MSLQLGKNPCLEFGGRVKPGSKFAGTEPVEERVARSLSENERAAFAKVVKGLGPKWAGRILVESICDETERKKCIVGNRMDQIALAQVRITRENKAELEQRDLLHVTHVPETRLTVDGFAENLEGDVWGLAAPDIVGLGKSFAILLPGAMLFAAVGLIPGALLYPFSKIGGLVLEFYGASAAVFFGGLAMPRLGQIILTRKAERAVRDSDSIELVVAVLEEVADSFFRKNAKSAFD